jgi:hypothetical protein
VWVCLCGCVCVCIGEAGGAVLERRAGRPLQLLPQSRSILLLE